MKNWTTLFFYNYLLNLQKATEKPPRLFSDKINSKYATNQNLKIIKKTKNTVEDKVIVPIFLRSVVSMCNLVYFIASLQSRRCLDINASHRLYI